MAMPARGIGADKRPRYITRCGRTSARISSRSSEISSTERAGAPGLQQLCVHIGDGADVEAARRLIGEDETRRLRQHAPEDELLHVAAREQSHGAPPADGQFTS